MLKKNSSDSSQSNKPNSDNFLSFIKVSQKCCGQDSRQGSKENKKIGYYSQFHQSNKNIPKRFLQEYQFCEGKKGSKMPWQRSKSKKRERYEFTQRVSYVKISRQNKFKNYSSTQIFDEEGKISRGSTRMKANLPTKQYSPLKQSFSKISGRTQNIRMGRSNRKQYGLHNMGSTNPQTPNSKGLKESFRRKSLARNRSQNQEKNQSGFTSSIHNCTNKNSSSILQIFSKQEHLSYLSSVHLEKTFKALLDYVQKLKTLASYSQKIIQLYDDFSDWQQLLFLTYKKYYVERQKLVNFLRGAAPIPYFLMQTTSFEFLRQIELYKYEAEIKSFVTELNNENQVILSSLKNLYNLVIDKSGQYVNLCSKDNFSKKIYHEMMEQINLLKHNLSTSPATTNNRLYQILQCAVVIANLDGDMIQNELELENAEKNMEKFFEKGEKFFKKYFF